MSSGCPPPPGGNSGYRSCYSIRKLLPRHRPLTHAAAWRRKTMILWTFPSVQPPLFFFASSRHHLLWYLRAGRLFAFAHPSHICLHKIRRHVDLLVQLSLTPRPPLPSVNSPHALTWFRRSAQSDTFGRRVRERRRSDLACFYIIPVLFCWVRSSGGRGGVCDTPPWDELIRRT